MARRNTTRTLGFFVIATVTAVAGACSSTTIVEVLPDGGLLGNRDGATTTRSDGGTGDGGTRTDARVGGDGAIVGGDGSVGGTCPDQAPTAADLDQSGGWKAPRPRNKTACSKTDLQTFQSNFNN